MYMKPSMSVGVLTKEQEAFDRELEELRREGNRRIGGHPFVQLLERGEATEEQLKVQCVQQYFHTVAFVNGITRLLSRCKISEVQRELAGGVYEEHTGAFSQTGPHLEVFYRYAASWGISREELSGEGYYLVPEAMALINWYMYAADHLSPLEGIAVFAVAAEGVNVTFPGMPGLSRRFADALVRYYGKSSEDVLFWELHDKADQEHSGTGVRVLVRYVEGEAEKGRIRSVIRMTQDAWSLFLEAPLRWRWEDVTAVHSGALY
jgi:pyrroloquinoline quinone (PQQ) biosynthesis protein C